MRAMLTATTILALTVPAIAGQVPDKSFFNGMKFINGVNTTG